MENNTLENRVHVMEPLQQSLELVPATDRPVYPWEVTSLEVAAIWTTKSDRTTHTMLKWLVKNSPNTSIAKIVRDGMNTEIRRLMAIYGPPDWLKGVDWPKVIGDAD